MDNLLQPRDIIVLDGIYGGSEWPEETAAELLSDPSPWDPVNTTQWKRFHYVAQCINGYNRIPIRLMSTQMRFLMEASSLNQYSTQYLLDIFFYLLRSCHWSQSGAGLAEPKLREILDIIIRRIHSTNPPIFLPKGREADIS